MNIYRMIKPGIRERIVVRVAGKDTRFVMQFVTALLDMGYTQVHLPRFLWHIISGR